MANKVEVHEAMIDINELYEYDKNISEINYYEYKPQTQANNNTVGHQIKIDINAHDIYTLPSRSYISITGQKRKQMK